MLQKKRKKHGKIVFLAKSKLNSIKVLTWVSLNRSLNLGRVDQWVKALQLESEGSRFKPPIGTLPGLGTQPRYEAPSDLRVEIKEKAEINIVLVRLSLRE